MVLMELCVMVLFLPIRAPGGQVLSCVAPVGESIKPRQPVLQPAGLGPPPAVPLSPVAMHSPGRALVPSERRLMGSLGSFFTLTFLNP